MSENAMMVWIVLILSLTAGSLVGACNYQLIADSRSKALVEIEKVRLRCPTMTLKPIREGESP